VGSVFDMSEATRRRREIARHVAPHVAQLCACLLDLDVEVDARHEAVLRAVDELLRAVDELGEVRSQRDRTAEQLSQLVAEYDAATASSGPRSAPAGAIKPARPR
jgi:HEAT repeat protein